MNATEFQQLQNDANFQAIVAFYKSIFVNTPDVARYQTKQHLFLTCKNEEKVAEFWADKAHEYCAFRATIPTQPANGNGHAVAQQPATEVRGAAPDAGSGAEHASERQPQSAEEMVMRNDPVYTYDDDGTPLDENGRVPHGHIHGWMVKQAGRLRNAGMDIPTLEKTLLATVHAKCAPPIDDSKVKQVARSFAKYKPEPDASLPMQLNQTPDPGSPAAQQAAQQAIDVTKWREAFRSVGEMESGPIVEVIHGVLQEGTCFLGANAGDGKTLISLAMAKAISTGTPFLGLPGFFVSQPRQVIYLIPESRDRAFRKRCESFRIPDDPTKFLARTISTGPTMPLNDPYLLQAVKETNAVVFLDTAVRFTKSQDENSATQNQMLVNDVLALLQAGAICVVLVHHATKASQTEAMTLENMLRGTGDFAAMCDMAYGIRKDRTLYANGSGPMELDLVSLKDREQVGELTHLRLAASKRVPDSIVPIASVIDLTGNFAVVDSKATREREVQALLILIKNDPTISAKDLAAETGNKERTVKAQLLALGWHRRAGGKDGGSPWHQDVNGKCPFEEAPTVEVKPPKKTIDLTLAQVVKDLGKLFAASSTMLESTVLQWADSHGIKETGLNKARKRLGITVSGGKDDVPKTWSMPLFSAGAPAQPKPVANAAD